jgi:Holliday junction DNA helicase RuvA
MIGRLRGRIEEKDEDSAIIDVGGVGYHVFCSGRTLARLHIGEVAQFVIETHVREEHIHLYGFTDAIEREWFRALTSVQGVGNRTGLTILSAYAPAQLVQAIIAKDISAFKAISGIGPKLAERIVTELKDKVLKLPTGNFEPVGASSSSVKGKAGKPAAPVAAVPSHLDDAISALVNLGYSRSEAYSAALKASQDEGAKANLDALIKSSLKELLRA